MKSQFVKLTLISLLHGSFLMAQNAYEPTAMHPYGMPNPNAPAEIQDFQPLIGICDCLSYTRGADTNWLPPVKMTWEFKYIMNGMAVQDHSLKEDGIHSGNIRQFNVDSARWYVHYYTTATASPSLRAWEGNKINDQIILHRSQKSPGGMDGFYKITFYNITEEGFNWLGEWVNLDESIKYPTWRIDCKKR